MPTKYRILLGSGVAATILVALLLLPLRHEDLDCTSTVRELLNAGEYHHPILRGHCRAAARTGAAAAAAAALAGGIAATLVRGRLGRLLCTVGIAAIWFLPQPVPGTECGSHISRMYWRGTVMRITMPGGFTLVCEPRLAWWIGEHGVVATAAVVATYAASRREQASGGPAPTPE